MGGNLFQAVEYFYGPARSAGPYPAIRPALTEDHPVVVLAETQSLLGGGHAGVSIDEQMLDALVFGANTWVGKYSKVDGSEIWRRRSDGGCPGQEATTRGVAVDLNDQIVLVAHCTVTPGSIDFGGGPIDCQGVGFFAVKYAADGTHQWSEGFYAIEAFDVDIGLISDPGPPLNRPVVVGRYAFNPASIGYGLDLTSAGTSQDQGGQNGLTNVFVLQLDP